MKLGRAPVRQRNPRVLIAEQLVLLCIDSRTGALEIAHDRADIDHLAAAALVLDLAERRHLRYNAGYVALDADLPINHPQLVAAERVLAGFGSGLALEAAIELIEARITSLAEGLLESLFRRDVLHRQRSAWLPWAAKRYPLRSLQAHNEAIQEIRNAASLTPVSTLRALGLLILVEGAGRLAAVLDASGHERATRRLDLIGRNHTSGEQGLLAQLRRFVLE